MSAARHEPTSLSLLERIARQPASEDWSRLAACCKPLLHDWLRRYEVQAADADDLIQDVLAVVVAELPKFQHNRRTGAFRSWLRRILVNRLRHHWRSRKYQPDARGTSSIDERLNSLEDDRSDVSHMWDEEYEQHVLDTLLETVRPGFQPKTWEAFRRQIFDGQSPPQIAKELDMKVGSVYMARNRVLAALRREADGLMDL